MSAVDEDFKAGDEVWFVQRVWMSRPGYEKRVRRGRVVAVWGNGILAIRRPWHRTVWTIPRGDVVKGE